MLDLKTALGNVAKGFMSHGILEFLVIYPFKEKDRHNNAKENKK